MWLSCLFSSSLLCLVVQTDTYDRTANRGEAKSPNRSARCSRGANPRPFTFPSDPHRLPVDQIILNLDQIEPLDRSTRPLLQPTHPSIPRSTHPPIHRPSPCFFSHTDPSPLHTGRAATYSHGGDRLPPALAIPILLFLGGGLLCTHPQSGRRCISPGALARPSRPRCAPPSLPRRRRTA